MATPITWQTIQGRSLGEAAVPMHYAAQSIMGGFDRMGKAFDEQQAIAQKQLNTADEANVQGFLDRLQQARTPEEVAALEASGEMDAYTGAINNKALLEKLRGGYASRTAGLMQQTTAQNTFDDAVEKRTSAPIFEAYRIAGLNNDNATQARLLADNPNLRGWADQVEKDKAYERKMVEQGRADKTYGLASELAAAQQPGNLIAAKNQHTTALNTQQDLATAQSTKELLKEAAQAQASYLDGQRSIGLSRGKIAVQLGLPVNAAGLPKTDDYTTTNLAALDAAAVKAGLPTTEAYIGNDTRTANVVYDALAKSGKYPIEVMQANRDSVRGIFNSALGTSAVGMDAADDARIEAERKVGYEEVAKNNWYVSGSPNASNDYKALAETVPSLINKNSSYWSENDIPAIQTLLHDLATNGLEVAPGKFMSPSVNDVTAALRTAEGGWFSEEKRADNVKEILKNMAAKPAFKARIEEAERADKYQRKQRLKEALREADKK